MDPVTLTGVEVPKATVTRSDNPERLIECSYKLMASTGVAVATQSISEYSSDIKPNWAPQTRTAAVELLALITADINAQLGLGGKAE